MKIVLIGYRRRISATLSAPPTCTTIRGLMAYAVSRNAGSDEHNDALDTEFIGWQNWNVTITRPWPADPITLLRVNTTDKIAPLIEGLEGPLILELRPCVSSAIQKPQPQEITPAQQPEQSRSQPKEGTTMSQQVNASIPVQTVTFVFGHRIDHMGKTELFTAAQAVAAQIKGLEESNKAVGSVAIEQEIDGLKHDLQSIRRLLDDKFSAGVATAAEVVATDAE
jgi:hypothetical protein